MSPEPELSVQIDSAPEARVVVEMPDLAVTAIPAETSVRVESAAVGVSVLPSASVDVAVEPVAIPVAALAHIGPQGPSGPQGLTGEAGETGATGPPGASGDASYVHTQSVLSDVWDVDHGLGKYPSVEVIDSGGNVLLADVNYLGIDRLRVVFAAPNTGKVYVN